MVDFILYRPAANTGGDLTGAVMVATMVLIYSIVGGIRASIWTDGAQSITMMIAMAILLITAFGGVGGVGGVSGAIELWRAIPGFLDPFPDDLLFPGALGLGLFIVGWLFAGFSVVGQPHVMVRFMALDHDRNMGRARAWYYGYFTVFYLLATGVGMLSRLYLPDLADIDPELALPMMATELLPPVLVGLILAGIFAATERWDEAVIEYRHGLDRFRALAADARADPYQVLHWFVENPLRRLCLQKMVLFVLVAVVM
jgi:SSS family solute:Na+ symporter/sodium/proline symporter